MCVDYLKGFSIEWREREALASSERQLFDVPFLVQETIPLGTFYLKKGNNLPYLPIL